MEIFIFFGKALLLGGMCACITASLEAMKLFNIKYGDNPRNIMDIYLPVGIDEHTPFIILMHPGAWDVRR